MNLITQQQVIDEARKHLGTPYSHMGRGGASGMDCIGLSIVVGQSLGQLPLDLDASLPAYQPSSLPRLMDVFWTHTEQIPVDDVRPGYGYLVRHAKRRFASHVAICTERGVIQVSPYDTLMKVVEHRITDELRARFVYGWKYKGVIA